ncbi:acyl dehydratase [Nocardioides cavernae]|uniref:Acyl dehydratase n=1 Tax=Nocardioides cavernae TaxID=1921566 RepID=A0A7Y9KRX8_9ACTN|nr:MaoC/PaaZ C-terminal domain-containing protein [Nocardioides cavernae]NYE35832.1 acyl dehydratase [Nocardioides cavernae]
MSTAVRVGDRLPEWDLPRVSREKMKTLAPILADPNPIHWDVDVVRGLGMGERPVNQGPSNMAYVMNMLAAWSGGHDRLRRLRVRFAGNVLGDDHVVARGVVSAVRDEGGRTVATCDVELVVVDGAVALTGTADVDVTDLSDPAGSPSPTTSTTTEER